LVVEWLFDHDQRTGRQLPVDARQSFSPPSNRRLKLLNFAGGRA
jgi:hypothetical protein